MSHPLEPSHLDGAHRATLEHVLSHPISGNVEWPAVVSLLEQLGQVETRHDGKVAVTIGDETRVIERPRGKDLSTEELAELRRMLRGAGYQ